MGIWEVYTKVIENILKTLIKYLTSRSSEVYLGTRGIFKAKQNQKISVSHPSKVKHYLYRATKYMELSPLIGCLVQSCPSWKHIHTINKKWAWQVPFIYISHTLLCNKYKKRKIIFQVENGRCQESVTCRS